MSNSGLASKIEQQLTYQSIKNYLSVDKESTISISDLTQRLLKEDEKIQTVLDLGCGDGRSAEFFKTTKPSINWSGIDIEDSPEVNSRTSHDNRLLSFNGIDIPFENEDFDLIYSNQVLEHVRHPDALINEAYRVLKPGGFFIGSVSQLEPYHSYSIFNFTPYAITQVFGDAGFKIIEIHAGTDAWSLINRQLLNRKFSPIWKYSLLHGLISMIGTLTRLKPVHVNFLKTQFSGHLLFLAMKPHPQEKKG